MLSVVIPIGDLSRDETNLKRILAQGNQLKNIEVILVFDFEFQSRNIQEFERLTSKNGIKIVRSSGRNPNLARLTGLTVSSCEYIVFCDSDDICDLFELDKISESLDQPHGIYFFPFDRNKFDDSQNQEDFQSVSYCNIIKFPGLWRTIVPKSALNEVFFVPTKMGEDLALLCGALLSTSEIIFGSSKFYKYIQSSNNNLSSVKNQEVYLETLFHFSQLMKNYVKKLNSNSLLASAIYTSFLLSTLKSANLVNGANQLRGVLLAMIKNIKLGIGICITLPIVFLIQILKLRIVK